MAIPSRQIGWGTKDNLLWQISKQLEQLTNVTATASATTTTTTTLPVYKVYTALLTQTGTSNPVATVFENTLGDTIAWTRHGEGNFWGTLSSTFTDINKTYLSASNSFRSNVKDLSFFRLDNNTFVIYNASSTGTLEDEMSAFIEIRVYN